MIQLLKYYEPFPPSVASLILLNNDHPLTPEKKFSNYVTYDANLTFLKDYATMIKNSGKKRLVICDI